jgi:hypothetical protein
MQSDGNSFIVWLKQLSELVQRKQHLQTLVVYITHQVELEKFAAQEIDLTAYKG